MDKWLSLSLQNRLWFGVRYATYGRLNGRQSVLRFLKVRNLFVFLFFPSPRANGICGEIIDRIRGGIDAVRGEVLI